VDFGINRMEGRDDWRWCEGRVPLEERGGHVLEEYIERLLLANGHRIKIPLQRGVQRGTLGCAESQIALEGPRMGIR